MAIVSNVDLINTYDGNFQVVSTRILPDVAPDTDEFAAQCLALETLRSLIASGMTVEQYNALDEPGWQAIIADSYARSRLNVNAPAAILSENDRNAAANIGGNYFEHGYVTIMAGVQQADKVQFTRIGGL